MRLADGGTLGSRSRGGLNQLGIGVSPWCDTWGIPESPPGTSAQAEPPPRVVRRHSAFDPVTAAESACHISIGSVDEWLVVSLKRRVWALVAAPPPSRIRTRDDAKSGTHGVHYPLRRGGAKVEHSHAQTDNHYNSSGSNCGANPRLFGDGPGGR